MSDDPVVRAHTDALITTLESAGLTVGDGIAPQEEPPFVVVYKIAGGNTSGVLSSPDEDATIVYQLTCVGASRQQAEWLEDTARILLQGFEVPGRSIARVSLDMHGGLQRDDREPGFAPIFWTAPRFRVLSTPAPGS